MISFLKLIIDLTFVLETLRTTTMSYIKAGWASEMNALWAKCGVEVNQSIIMILSSVEQQAKKKEREQNNFENWRR